MVTEKAEAELISLLIDKKELRGISQAYAATVLDEYLRDNPEILAAYKEDPDRFVRKKEFQQMRSDVRQTLRKAYGVFFTGKYPAKRDDLVDALIEDPTREHAEALLAIHRSTAERLPYYGMLYDQLFAVTGTPGSILDLGCGFNPFSYPYMPAIEEYHCADIACEDLSHVGRFLESLGVEHSEHCVDLSDPSAAAVLPEADVAFAFKLFDSLEDRRRDVTADLLDAIPAEWIIASFPTKSIGQGTAISPRKWFEELVTGRVANTVTLPNEQFFIITG